MFQNYFLAMAVASSELESFVRKFVNLWQYGQDAKLELESEGGEAFVNICVVLGHGPLGHHHHAVHGGGRPSKQPRRERREEDRRVAAAAEKLLRMLGF